MLAPIRRSYRWFRSYLKWCALAFEPMPNPPEMEEDLRKKELKKLNLHQNFQVAQIAFLVYLRSFRPEFDYDEEIKRIQYRNSLVTVKEDEKEDNSLDKNFKRNIKFAKKTLKEANKKYKEIDKEATAQDLKSWVGDIAVSGKEVLHEFVEGYKVGRKEANEDPNFPNWLSDINDNNNEKNDKNDKNTNDKKKKNDINDNTTNDNNNNTSQQ